MGELHLLALYSYSQRENLFGGEDTTQGPASWGLTSNGRLTEMGSYTFRVSCN